MAVLVEEFETLLLTSVQKNVFCVYVSNTLFVFLGMLQGYEGNWMSEYVVNVTS